jgi:nickel-dependent lactate racemase
MQIALPYGGRLKRFDITNLLGRFRCDFPEPLSSETLDQRIHEGLKQYYHLLKGRRILTIVNDFYRRTPNDRLLQAIWDYVKDGNIIIAAGSHRKPTFAEMSDIFGCMLPKVNDKILFHDCYDQSVMVDFGVTSRGTPVKLNRAIAEAEVIVTINSVEPHFFAGFTGGRKSIVPGLASFETIQANHKFAKDIRATSLILDGNPLHEDLEEAIDLIKDKLLLTIQCITNREASIIDVYSGELRPTFDKACVVAREFCTIEVPQQYDIVIANCEPPLDINLYQLQKAQEHGCQMAREGGVLIVMGACLEGIGSDYFMKSAEKYPTPQMALASADTDDSFGMHKLIKTARQLQHFHIFYVTAIDVDIVNKVYFRAFNDIEAALSEAFKIMGDQAQVAILEDAGYSVPIAKPLT